MRKLFGPSKSKNKPSRDSGAEEVVPVPTPIHPHHARFLPKPSPQQRQKQTEAQAAPQAAVRGQAPVGVGEAEPGWENIPTPGNTSGVGQPPPLMGGGASWLSSYHSIPSPNLNPDYNGRPPSPSLTNTSLSRQTAGYSPNPNDYGARPVPTKKTSATSLVALGILLALDPYGSPAFVSNTRQTVSHSRSEERFYSSSENGHPQQQQHQQMFPVQQGGGYVTPPPERKEKRRFWSSGRDRDRWDQQPYEYVQSQPPPNAPGDAPGHSVESERTLTSMIDYLAATNSEDRSVILEVCDRASLNETNAKEAVKALRSEFKYGQPHAQLAAAKLWSILLRNSTDIFISQSRQRKFLDTLEELIESGRSTPVVTDRLLEIIAAAAYTYGRHENGCEKDGFRGLWLRVKPADKPDEGIPFDSEDGMFSPPSARASTYENGAIVPAVALQQASPLPAENFAPVRHKPAGTRNRIIPHEEDIRRLFQECKMAVGNATLLSEALLTCTPSSLKNNAIIKEFHKKCENSQKLVFAQIEWVTAQAEQSRVKRTAEREQRGGDDGEGREKERESRKKKKDGRDDDETIEEKLLVALLGANEELLSALRQYDDLYQILVEKKSRNDVRMDRREISQHQLQQQTEHLAVVHGIGASRSRSPSPARSVSGSPPSKTRPQSHGGQGSNVGHAHSQSHQGTPGVGGVYTTHQGSDTNVNQRGQLLGQQGTVYANPPYADEGHSQTNIKQYRLPPEHSIPSLPPPPKAPFGPRAPSNFSLRSRLPYPNGNDRPNDDFSNNKHSRVDHHGGASSIALTHSEADDGSYDDAHNEQKQGTESGSPLLDILEEFIELGRSTPDLIEQLPATVEFGRTTPILTDQLPAIISATTDSMSVCLYPSGNAKSQLESRENQCLSPTGDRDLERFFGLSCNPSVAEEESQVSESRIELSLPTDHSALDQSEVSGKVVVVLKEASCIEISRGVFNSAGNDVHNNQTDQQVHYYSTSLTPSPQQKRPEKESKNVWPMALLYVGLGFAIGVIPTAILKWIGR